MHKKNYIKILLFFVSIAILSSCINTKKFTYFQKGINDKDTVSIFEAYVPKIQAGDILSIYVNSLSTEASTFFNPYTASSSSGDASSSGGSSGGGGLSDSAAPGFLVNAVGNIELPLIGTVSVNGLTTMQAHDVIKKKLEVYLKEPTVTVRFLNYKISILGEISKPGVYVVPNERVTLPEMMTIAGDLTIFAKRNEIEVIRDVNGKKEFGTVDLTSREVFSSPYYYLHANDIVYIKPLKSKVAQSDLTFRIIPLVISVVTLIILIFTKV